MGNERDAAVLMVSPWATATWNDRVGVNFADRCADADRHVISYDRRGTGASSRGVTDLGLDAQVVDLAAVADAQAAVTSDVVASFDGTPIAIAYAARFPSRVRKLVLWQPFVNGAHWIPDQRVRSLIDLAHADWELACRTLSTVWTPRGSVEQQRWLTKGFRERLTPDVFTGYPLAVQAMDVIDEARLVQAETLILHPTEAGLPR